MQAQVADLLKRKKTRVTVARNAIIDVVFADIKPVSAPKILDTLRENNILVNKTTVYRELMFLVNNKILKQVYITPNIIHYESAFLPHHHHLICNNCGGVQEVDCVVDTTKLLQKVNDKGFDVNNHRFELYGTCANCH